MSKQSKTPSAREQRFAEARKQAGSGIDEEQHRPDLDAGKPRRGGIAAHRIDPHAQHRAAKHVPGED